MNKPSALFLTIFLIPLLVFGQKLEMEVLKFDDFKTQILAHHPFVKQANLLTDIAKAELTMTRGLFDPTAQSELNSKEFGDKMYYEYWDSYLKVPILNFADVKFGWERNTGVFVDEQYKTTQNGLLYAGLSVPLGRGLFTDARKNALNQAKIYTEINDAERLKIVNKILFEAAKDYWNWYFIYNQLELLQDAYVLANERFEGTKQRAIQGDAAFIDTVETKLLVQQREIEIQSALIDLINLKLKIGTYLWDENQNPLDLKLNVIPSYEFDNLSLKLGSESDILTFALGNNPEIRKINLKVKQLDSERRLAIENLKPDLRLNYNVLSASGSINNEFVSGYQNNFKWGFSAYLPILLRKERGKLKSIQLKTLQTKYELNDVRREIETSVKISFNEINTLNRILLQQENMNNSYRILRDAETTRFNNGESSVFLVNARENKYVEGQIKLFELKSKYQKSLASLIFNLGLEQ